MKLFNEIVAEQGGDRARASAVENAEPVEYGQLLLFLIEP